MWCNSSFVPVPEPLSLLPEYGLQVAAVLFHLVVHPGSHHECVLFAALNSALVGHKSPLKNGQMSRNKIHYIHKKSVHADDAVGVGEHGSRLVPQRQEVSARGEVSERHPAEVRQAVVERTRASVPVGRGVEGGGDQGRQVRRGESHVGQHQKPQRVLESDFSVLGPDLGGGEVFAAFVVKLGTLERGHETPQNVSFEEPEGHLDGAHEVGQEEVDVLDEVVQVLVGVEEAEELGTGEVHIDEEENHDGVDLVRDLDQFGFAVGEPQTRAPQYPPIDDEDVFDVLVGRHCRLFEVAPE
jgi:hypothetical protein